MKKVLLTRIFPGNGIKSLTKAGFNVTRWDKTRPMTQNELISKAQGHHALYCTLSDRIDKEFLDACPDLEMISQFAVGYDNIDIPAANKRGIPVGYAPDAMSEATADIAFGLMITTARKMFFMHKGISRGAWQYFKPNAHLGIELKSKTLGIYGLGRIGMKMAERCKGAYNMDIIYHNRNRNSKAEKELAAQYVSFQELLQGSDVLSVHCALTKETRRIFNTSAFEQMKSTAIFINTSRGAVHHEQDLHEALQNGQIWGAGLDVTDPEPMLPDNPLLEMENVSILPHIGSATIEARHKMSEMVVSNIIAFFNGDKIPYLVNPEVFH